jgi:hypothetical protein
MAQAAAVPAPVPKPQQKESLAAVSGSPTRLYEAYDVCGRLQRRSSVFGIDDRRGG